MGDSVREKPAGHVESGTGREQYEITRWQNEEFTRIKSEARHRRACIVFIEESGFMFNPTRRRTYAPSGDHQWKRSLIRMPEILLLVLLPSTPENQRANFIFDMLGDNANFKADQERRGPNKEPEHFGRGGQADDVIVLRAKYRREHKGIGPEP